MLVSEAINVEGKAKERLMTMKSCYDGFEIAEKDLLMRGPGDFLKGTGDGAVRQSGGVRFRLAELWLMDHPQGGALAALQSSRMLMRGNWKALLRVDLSFWWYYLLVTVITAVGYLDVILALAGIPLPMEETVMFFATIAAYCVLITALSLWKKAQVETSYVLAYEAIAHPEPVEITIEIQ